MKQSDILARLWGNTMTIPFSGCWVWLGSVDGRDYATGDGYGRIRVDGKRLKVHRVAYEIFVGPIPEDLRIDHKCRVHTCWNPDHLHLVTSQVNTLLGIGPSATNARKDTCIHGHAFTEENTYVYRGKRHTERKCRKCRSDRIALYRRKGRFRRPSDPTTSGTSLSGEVTNDHHLIRDKPFYILARDLSGQEN